MKTLFVLVSNGGDGSYYPQYTLNAKYIQHLEDKYESGEMDYEDLGVDGDGFHYDTLQVPDDFTLVGNGGDIAGDWVPGQDEDEDE